MRGVEYERLIGDDPNKLQYGLKPGYKAKEDIDTSFEVVIIPRAAHPDETFPQEDIVIINQESGIVSFAPDHRDNIPNCYKGGKLKRKQYYLIFSMDKKTVHFFEAT